MSLDVVPGRLPRLRLPPFARRIIDMRRKGLVPVTGQVAISVNAWDLVHRDREDAIVLPPGEDPQLFDWKFVAGLPVLMSVSEKSTEVADVLAALVISAGSTGCAALIVPTFGQRYGWRLYQSHLEGLRCAA